MQININSTQIPKKESLQNLKKLGIKLIFGEEKHIDGCDQASLKYSKQVCNILAVFQETSYEYLVVLGRYIL